MKPGDEPETDGERSFCPECGAEESGYFCRNCGTLLRGQDRVLCPRCHGIVPAADFCSRCGQGLKGMALNLQQLAMAGADFWVTGSGTPPAAAPGEGAGTTWEPDEATPLAAPELPEWLSELPTEQAPAEVQARIHPTLRPLDVQPAAGGQSRYLILVVLLMGAILIGLVAVAVFLLAQGAA
ncbi:MAG TPA: hypothetical protein VLC52_09875 [Anaerolineae bacterium]|nr:hypothetical protein [Anaerolineae bacterium]